MSSEEKKYAGPQELIAAKKKWQMPCSYHFYRDPPQIVSAEGVWMTDHLGRRYLDCFSGVTVMNAGHGNRDILDVAFVQAATLQHTTSIYLTEPVLQLAEQLARITPGDLKRSFFCASGSEANEGAMLLAATYTGRHEFLALEGGLHGRTRQTMAATGLPMWRIDPDPLDNVYFVKRAICSDCAWNESTPPDCGYPCVQAVRDRILEVGAERLAAMILEPIAGNGGILVPPAGYLRSLSALCQENGMLLILDEIQTGFGRTGAWFRCQAEAVEPDIMTMAKALGNGFPIAAFITRDEIADGFTRPSASTFGGNPMCAAAALATIAYHEKHRLAERADQLGGVFGLRLQELLAGLPGVHDVRGAGLMWGVELGKDDGQPDDLRCDSVLEEMKGAGYLIGKSGAGRNVLSLMPPLVIEQEQLSALVEQLCAILKRQ